MVKIKETMQIGLVTVFVGGVQGVSGHPREGCPDTLNPPPLTKLLSARVIEGKIKGQQGGMNVVDHESNKKPNPNRVALPRSGVSAFRRWGVKDPLGSDRLPNTYWATFAMENRKFLPQEVCPPTDFSDMKAQFVKAFNLNTHSTFSMDCRR